MLPAVLLANDSPTQVKTGKPDHKASFAVTWALYGKVSRNKSAIFNLANIHEKLFF